MAVTDHTHTQRLCLRPSDPADREAVAAVHRIHADPATNRYNPAGPVTDLDETRARMQTWHQAHDETGYGYWLVRESCEGPVIGVGGIQPKTVEGIEVFNLYYRFAPEAWGRGYAAETALAAIDQAASARPTRPVVAVCHADNLPSRRVAERIGMTRAGTVLHNGSPRMIYESPKLPSFAALRQARAD